MKQRVCLTSCRNSKQYFDLRNGMAVCLCLPLLTHFCFLHLLPPHDVAVHTLQLIYVYMAGALSNLCFIFKDASSVLLQVIPANFIRRVQLWYFHWLGPPSLSLFSSLFPFSLSLQCWHKRETSCWPSRWIVLLSVSQRQVRRWSTYFSLFRARSTPRLL